MSPAIAPDAIAARLRSRKGGAPPVLAAVGPETFLQEQVLRDVAATLLGDADSPDLLTLQGAATSTDADQDTLARFFDETRTGSLFGGRKVVALRHASALVSRYKKDFLHWLEHPGSAAVAVILASELPAPVLTAIEKAGMVVRCGGRGARGEAPESFVTKRAASRGKRLGRAETDLLLDLIGRDLSGLENAVEILSLHAGEREVIERQDIEALFQSAREGSVWAFGDKLVEGDVAGALAEANRCFNEGIPESARSRKVTRSESTIAVRLISAFTMAVTRVVEARAQIDAGVPRRQVKLSGRVPWSAQQAVLRAAARRRPPALEALVVFAEETDRGLKSGGPAGRAAIARLVGAVSRVP
jgi:DNA polymerase III delta subunit